jgi:hypothetical protein
MPYVISAINANVMKPVISVKSLVVPEEAPSLGLKS